MPLVRRFAALAKELRVVLPISFYERANNAYYNSLAVIDADGAVLGRYRKAHIPDGPGYQEKWYFTPGDSGFQVFKIRPLKTYTLTSGTPASRYFRLELYRPIA